MSSPFPGMDPYLEAPRLWTDVRHGLITAIQELLNQVIRPKYVARIEIRTYMVPDDDPDHDLYRVPDVKIEYRPVRRSQEHRPGSGGVAIAEPVIIRQSDPIREGRVEIQEVASREVVTVIELLSPSNKLNGAAGRKSFLEKKEEILGSVVNWVEIDLLRGGTPNPVKKRFPKHQYLVYSSPADMRPDGKAWPIRLQDPLPVIGIPLRDPDPDAPLDLQAALTLAYDRAAYNASADYTADPVPPLPPGLTKWANKLLKRKKVR
ncbi:MAG: uncharacterized protein JWO38_1177 [Gemmataceae bacterium]|nr:uncharacterized protein [Gemmataceae bacterium]